MKKITKSEYIHEFNRLMRLFRDRVGDLNDFDWSEEDLEDIGQERLYDLNRLVARLNILVVTPFKAESED